MKSKHDEHQKDGLYCITCGEWLPGSEKLNCPKGLDPDYQRKVCRNCGRSIMLVRRSHRNKAHWQHVGDGLAQYRSWK